MNFTFNSNYPSLEHSSNKLHNDHANANQQQLSMSMGTATGSLSKRSSKILNSLIKMSTATSATVPNSLEPTETKFASLTRKNGRELTSILKTSKPRPQSSFSITDHSFFSTSSSNTLSTSKFAIGGDYKSSDSDVKLNPDNASDWTASMVRVWLGRLGMLPGQIKNAMKHVTGKSP